jgi:uncharacterized protein (DUF1778 family)
MARPQKPEGEARDKLMQVRLQGREYELLKEAAERTGLDLSAWVREKLLNAAQRDPTRRKRRYL